jgi:hypothetical protein
MRKSGEKNQNYLKNVVTKKQNTYQMMNLCNNCNFYYYKEVKEEKVRKVNDEKVKDEK